MILHHPIRLIALASLPLLLAGQTVGPDELRVSYAAYAPPPATAFRSEANLVEVGVVVRGLRGEAVDGLQESDFEIYDAGTKREIRSFSVLDSGGRSKAPAALSAAQTGASNTPQTRYIALLFDDFIVDAPGSPLKDAQQKGLASLKIAAERFVKESLQPGDQISVFSTARGQILPFTREVPKLLDCIRKLNGNYRDPMFLKAVVLSAIGDVVTYMAKMPAYRMVLLASSGNNAELGPNDLPLSHARERTIITRALAAGLVINALDGKGLYTDAPGPSGPLPEAFRAKLEALSRPKLVLDLSNEPLASLSYGTGGSFFHNSNDLVKGFKELIQPDVRYLLAFSSDAPRDGRYHPLKVKLTAPNHYEVEARPGYYAPNQKEARLSPRTIDCEIVANDTLSGLPVRFEVRPATVQDGQPAVLTEIHVDLKQLEFQMRDGRRMQKLTFAAVLLDVEGNVVTGKIGALEFALKDATFQRLSADGVNGTLVLAAPAGTYRVRAVVQDQSVGRISAVTNEIVVR